MLITKQPAQIAQIAFGHFIEYFCFFLCPLDRGRVRKQWLFYPDYIVKLTNGEIWIIETKGGMNADYTKNIDLQVENKFTAFKDYAKRYGVKWGFVRDIDEDLFICNTEYTDEMIGENWQPLESVLK